MQPKPLSEIVLAALPAFAEPPSVGGMARRLGYRDALVHAAYEALDAAGDAKIVRRGRSLHLVPVDYPGRICPVCRAEIAGHGRTCSKSCGMRVAWQKRDRQRQSEVMKASRAKRRDDPLETNRSHRTPEYRQRMSERNKANWADPVKKMRRVVAMEAAWQGPQAEERIAKARERELRLWSDPAWKERAVERMRTGRRGRFKRKVIELLAADIEMPDHEIAEKMGRTLEQTKMLMRRLFKEGLIGRPPVDRRKRDEVDLFGPA